MISFNNSIFFLTSNYGKIDLEKIFHTVIPFLCPQQTIYKFGVYIYEVQSLKFVNRSRSTWVNFPLIDQQLLGRNELIFHS
jgi:hypothetical protein